MFLRYDMVEPAKSWIIQRHGNFANLKMLYDICACDSVAMYTYTLENNDQGLTNVSGGQQ